MIKEKQYQVTLLATNKKFKPMSCLVKVKQDTDEDLTQNPDEKKKIIDRGIKIICCKRYLNGNDLKRMTFTKCKVRLYDKEKIELENKMRYEKIKEEKYASGEWKRPN